MEILDPSALWICKPTAPEPLHGRSYAQSSTFNQVFCIMSPQNFQVSVLTLANCRVLLQYFFLLRSPNEKL